MPIYNVGDNKNKELIFGIGDIKVSSGYLQDDEHIGVLVLNQQDAHPIGEEIIHEPNELHDKGESPVRMVFHKKASVDVLIERLEKVKSYMKDDE